MTEAEAKCRELVKATGVDPDKGPRYLVYRIITGRFTLGLIDAEEFKGYLRRLLIANPDLRKIEQAPEPLV